MFSLDFFERLYRLPPFLSPLLVAAAVVSFILTKALLWPVICLGALIILHLLRRPPLGFLAKLSDPVRITLCFAVVLIIAGLYAHGMI